MEAVPARRLFLRSGVAAVATTLVGRAASAAPRTVSPLRLSSLLTGEPLAGARLRVGGRELVSDARGRAVVDDAFPWSPVEIEADGHLLRHTCLREGGDLRLWPSDAVPTDVLRALVYGEGPLMRPAASTVDVVAHGALAEHGACQRTLATAVARATDDLGLRFRLVGEDLAAAPAPERPRVDVVVDASDPVVATGARAVFYRRTRGATVVGGRVVLSSCGVAHDDRTLLHELAHVMLGHSPAPGDLMAPDGAAGDPADGFSAQERLALALVRGRQPGNLPEDDDVELGPSPDQVALGTLLHRIVYAPGLAAESVFGRRPVRMAAGRRQSIVCAA